MVGYRLWKYLNSEEDHANEREGIDASSKGGAAAQRSFQHYAG